MIQRFTDRLAPVVEQWLNENVPAESFVEWDINLISEPRSNPDSLYVDHFVAVWIQWNDPDETYTIETRFSVPLSLATEEEITSSLQTAWDTVVVEQMASKME